MYEKLKEEMKRQGISGNQLSMKAMVSSTDFYSALKGKRPFFPAWRKRVADVLGKPEADLFSDEE